MVSRLELLNLEPMYCNFIHKHNVTSNRNNAFNFQMCHIFALLNTIEQVEYIYIYLHEKNEQKCENIEHSYFCSLIHIIYIVADSHKTFRMSSQNE